MSGLLPAAVYGLEVPAGDVMIPAAADFPSAFRITMAALDPTAAPEHHASLGENPPTRATLKLIRVPIGDDESDEDDEDDEMDALINGDDSDDDSEDEDANGGPSDPAKSKKAKREAAVRALKEALAADGDDDDEDEEMEGVNGKINKGKAVALDDDDEEDDDDIEDLGLDEYVICTLDPEKHYQQTLDITIGENETVYFKVIGTHGIYLTGNYVMPVDDSTPRGYGDEDDEDDEYDLDEDELDYDEDEESDDLDDIEDPRITELLDEEEAAPKLIASAKSSKKRAAEEQGLDDLIAKDAANGLSKKQQKKLKNNAGEASAAPATKDDKKSDKKVQFAKELEQGPTGSAADKKGKKEEKKQSEKKTEEKPATGLRTVQGVKVDDRKAGSGPKAKKGSMIGMRYIGKLENGQVFDSNKKGKPFTFKLGAGNVIKGWDIGVEGMAVGGERRITVPAKLAYGNQSVPGIPKNSTLIFDLKLIDLK